MKTKAALLIFAAFVLAAGAVVVAAWSLSGESGDSNGADRAVQPSRSPSPESSGVQPDVTPTASPAVKAGATSAPPGGPAEAVIRLVDARMAGDEDAARAVAGDAAVRQIYSFPPFNPREATIACHEDGASATCSLSASSPGVSMILTLRKVGTEWLVEQIEPVID